MKRKFSTRFWVIITLVFLVNLFLGMIVAPIQILFFLLFGWIWGVCRFVVGLGHEPIAVLIGAVAFLLLPILLHWFLVPLLRRFEKTWRFRQSVLASFLLVCFAAGGIAMVAGFHDLVWILNPKERLIEASMEAARRMQSTNNLKQLGLGIHNYNDSFRSLPSGGTILDDGRLGHSWMTLILPYCESNDIYVRLDFSKPWNDPANAPVFQEKPIPIFHSPYHFLRAREEPMDQNGFYKAAYSANQFVLPVGRSLTIGDITDGTSNTIMLGEIKENLPAWGNPLNGRNPQLGVNKSPYGFGSHFHGVMSFAFCDGSVRTVSEDIDPEVLKSFSTPNGGEQVAIP